MKILGLILAIFAPIFSVSAAPQELITRDFFVEHVSTIPANQGQTVGIFVRQKVKSSMREQKAPVVLFVHGATVPGVPDYDLNFKDYNWMAYLARAGFNTYTLDLSGYGGSPRPLMDDPCNVDPKQQSIIIPRPMPTVCAAHQTSQFNTIHDDWREIDAVVDYLRKINKVKRIHMIGWSAGGPRVGGYISQHPEKIHRAMLYAPSPPIEGPIPTTPSAGALMSLQTRDDFELKRWDPDARCQGQVEPGVRDAVWSEIMKWDKVGSTWGADGVGVMRGRIATQFGWTAEMVEKIKTPTVVIVGEFDRLDERRVVFDQMKVPNKVFINVSCASHFMVWEKQHLALHRSSLDWLLHGQIQNISRGEFRVDENGSFKRVSKLH